MHDRAVFTLVALLALACAVAPVRAQEEPPSPPQEPPGVETPQEPIPEEPAPEVPPKRWTDAEAREALDTFEEVFARTGYEFPVLEELDKTKAVRALAVVDHRNVARRLVVLLRDDREKIRNETIEGMANMKQNSAIVIPYLERIFEPATDPPEQTIRLLKTFGELRAQKMVRPCVLLFTHDDDGVAMAAVETVGKIGDRSVLLPLREIYELNNMDPGKGVSVRVDTGSAGSADARAAQAKGRRMEKLRRVHIRKEMLAVIEKALFDLTGEKIQSPEQLRDWMDKNKRLWR